MWTVGVELQEVGNDAGNWLRGVRTYSLEDGRLHATSEPLKSRHTAINLKYTKSIIFLYIGYFRVSRRLPRITCSCKLAFQTLMGWKWHIATDQPTTRVYSLLTGANIHIHTQRWNMTHTAYARNAKVELLRQKNQLDAYVAWHRKLNLAPTLDELMKLPSSNDRWAKEGESGSLPGAPKVTVILNLFKREVCVRRSLSWVLCIVLVGSTQRSVACLYPGYRWRVVHHIGTAVVDLISSIGVCSCECPRVTYMISASATKKLPGVITGPQNGIG